jgi:hypothetical protein
VIKRDTPQFKEVVAAYIQAALWSSVDGFGEPLDSNYSKDDLSIYALNRMTRDCEEFCTRAETLLLGMEFQQIGHDFWLTRNRHGVGFWDRGLGDRGNRLTEIAQSMGEIELYVGDDGQICLVPPRRRYIEPAPAAQE